MKFDEMQAAVRDAKQTINSADHIVAQMAEIVAGRLRKGNVPGRVLEALKRELRDYNIHTSSWVRR